LNDNVRACRVASMRRILLPRCNTTFIPASAPRFYVYAGRSAALAPVTGAGVGFLTQSIFEPG
jgi:hypothetical protein